MPQVQSATAPQRITCRGILAADGWAVLAAAVATPALQLGVFFAIRCATGERFAVLACLAAGAVWVALACPILAAGGGNWLSVLLRGGIVADASAVTLVALWLSSPVLGFAAAVEIYCIYAASALLGLAAVSLARTPAGRHAAAVAVALGLMLALATPFWMGGALKAAGHDARAFLADAAVRINPFYSITAAIFSRTAFTWNEARVLYGQVQQIQDYASAAPRWYWAPLLQGGLALLLGAIALVRLRARSSGPADHAPVRR